MKIIHCCLAAVYNDNHSYQENILPKMHKMQGHHVSIVASTETFINNMQLGYVKPSVYTTEYGVKLSRLEYSKILPNFIIKKLRIYKGLMDVLNEFKPDCIFLHDIQFLSIYTIIKYLKKNSNVVVYADGHTDFINSARNFISKHILHKVVYRMCAKAIEPYTRKFYGVLPLRVDFFKEVYKISPDKVELLVMGGDLTNIDFSKKEQIRQDIRISLEVSVDDFLIITGGKIDSRKGIIELMKAICQLDNGVKLLVFGSVAQDIQNEFNELVNSNNIRYLGWIPSELIYKYFFAADLSFFPGTHSVLWEQSVSLGIPGVFKKWEGIQHIDIGGNVLFIDLVNVNNIKNIILEIISDKTLFERMKKVASEKGIPSFSYYEIAKKALEN